jgi:protein tyrosine phosphatase (PTP) superfamily phosphohydrolase (DUF442 family)
MTARSAEWAEVEAAAGRPRPAALRRLVRALKLSGAATVLAAATIGGYWGVLQYEDNFHAVSPGVLYRAAQPSAGDLRWEAREYGIRSVLNLRGAHAGQGWYDEEVAASKALGLVHYDYGISAKREPTSRQIAELLEIVARAPKPLVIHCKSGADRSGLVAALYRYANAGASAAEADRQLSLLYGHFPYLWSPSGAMDRSFWAFVRSHSVDTRAAAR